MDNTLLLLYAQHGSYTKALTTLEQETRDWLKSSQKYLYLYYASRELKTEHKKLSSKMRRVLSDIQELGTVGDAVKLNDYLSEALSWNERAASR